jgi:hypothetical protein
MQSRIQMQKWRLSWLFVVPVRVAVCWGVSLVVSVALWPVWVVARWLLRVARLQRFAAAPVVLRRPRFLQWPAKIPAAQPGLDSIVIVQVACVHGQSITLTASSRPLGDSLADRFPLICFLTTRPVCRAMLPRDVQRFGRDHASRVSRNTTARHAGTISAPEQVPHSA